MYCIVTSIPRVSYFLPTSSATEIRPPNPPNIRRILFQVRGTSFDSVRYTSVYSLSNFSLDANFLSAHFVPQQKFAPSTSAMRGQSNRELASSSAVVRTVDTHPSVKNGIECIVVEGPDLVGQRCKLACFSNEACVYIESDNPNRTTFGVAIISSPQGEPVLAAVVDRY